MWQEATPPDSNCSPEFKPVNHETIVPADRISQGLSFKSHSSLESGLIVSKASVSAYEDRFQSAWDEYVQRHRLGSIFHLTAWKRVVEKVFKFEARYLFVAENGKIRGVLPLFLVSNFLFGRSLISTPIAVYGGICADNEHVKSLLLGAACRMAKDEGVQYLELREQWPVEFSEFLTKQLYVTFDLELPGNRDDLLARLPRDTRYMIRKAQKNGLEAVVDNTQLNTFYEIYSRSFSHLGTPVFPKRLFAHILEEFRDQVELTTVWSGKRAFASVLSFRFRDWILPYFGGSLMESRPLAANNFMYYEVMRYAVEAGVRSGAANWDRVPMASKHSGICESEHYLTSSFWCEEKACQISLQPIRNFRSRCRYGRLCHCP